MRLLGVGAVLHPTGTGAVEDGAGGASGGEQGGVEDDAEAVRAGGLVLIVELDMGPVVGLAAGAEGGEAGGDGVGEAEEVQGQVDEVGAEIEPEAGSGAGVFAPALADVGAETVHVALVVGDGAEGAGVEDSFGG